MVGVGGASKNLISLGKVQVWYLHFAKIMGRFLFSFTSHNRLKNEATPFQFKIIIFMLFHRFPT